MLYQISAIQSQTTESLYRTAKSYDDPFNDIELDVILTHSNGQSWRVPAYWAGGNEWRARFAPPRSGTYKIISVCSDQTKSDLHGQESTLEVSDYRGDNLILFHGSFPGRCDIYSTSGLPMIRWRLRTCRLQKLRRWW